MPQNTLEFPLLILDTASRRTWVGLKLAADKLVAHSEEQDPSKTLFQLVERVLAEAGLKLESIATIGFCAGPGSMLGARTASMAIRAWKGIGIKGAKNVFTYNSLQVGARIAAQSLEQGLVVTDARRSSWNTLPFPLDAGNSLRLKDNEALESETRTLVSFVEFPSWTKSEANIHQLHYDPTPIFEGADFLNAFSPAEEAAPLVIRHNEYKKWEAKIHVAPQP